MLKVMLVASGLAWGSFALFADAAPAHAKVRSTQSGPRAFAHPDEQGCSGCACGTSSYPKRQRIMFFSDSCNKGQCRFPEYWPMVEFKYPTGKKTASLHSTCNSLNVYNFGTCAC